MRIIRRLWNNISVSGKLYSVVGIMAVLIAGELLTLRFAMRTLSSVRAFVGGESLWSKAEKNAVISLQRFGRTHDVADFQTYLEYLRIPDGDHRARMELLKPDPNYQVVREGFLAGKIHPDDIDPMVDLLRRFNRIDYLARAIAAWSQGDELLTLLKAAGLEYRSAILARPFNAELSSQILARIMQLDTQLTAVEEEFSNALGEGSRWLERIVFSLLLIAVLMVESVGLTLTFFTARSISRALKELAEVAQRIGQGDFAAQATVSSEDELGALAKSVNDMGKVLEDSYHALEAKVSERTTELSRLALKNKELYEEAVTAVKARDEFLSIASHELKTPLTSLQLNLQSVAKVCNSSEKIEDIARLRQLADKAFLQARRMGRLLDELLDLTRLRSGKFELQMELCDLVSIVREAIDDGIGASRTELPIQLDAPTQIQGELDPIRIRQVVSNLVSNALKYGGGKPIAIKAQSDGTFATIEVRDHGNGISSEDQSRIFEAFERASDDVSITGLGLGLYISRQIIGAHKGTIRVDSVLGKGTTFSVILPLNPA